MNDKEIDILKRRCIAYRRIIQDFCKENKLDIRSIVSAYMSTGLITPNDERDLLDSITTEKPPIGIMPRGIWILQRANDLGEAIIRYCDSGKVIPQEWIDEYNELRGSRLNNMTVVEFAEETLGRSLSVWQKDYLEKVYDAYKKGRRIMVIPSRGNSKFSYDVLNSIAVLKVADERGYFKKEKENGQE